MQYENIIEAIFLKRLNRFVAEILINGQIFLCHVKNTGRCQELLLPNAKIFVQYNNSKTRKTLYSLISVIKNGKLINMDSQIPNYVVLEAIQNNKIKQIQNAFDVKSEVKFNNSRFDLFFKLKNQNCFMEVKGVTLENNNLAMFPDAPSERAIKHINELVYSIKYGYCPYLFFLIQMDYATAFSPNAKMHPQFAETLKNAYEKGVKILAYNCKVLSNEITLKDEVNINL